MLSERDGYLQYTVCTQGPLWACPKAGVGKAPVQMMSVQLKPCCDTEACALQACLCQVILYLSFIHIQITYMVEAAATRNSITCKTARAVLTLILAGMKFMQCATHKLKMKTLTHLCFRWSLCRSSPSRASGNSNFSGNLKWYQLRA